MTPLPWSSPRAVRSQRMRRSSSRWTTSRFRRQRDVEKALEDGAPLVHSDFGTNECYVWKLETDAVQAAIDAADVVVTRRYFQPRLIPNAIEPRGVLAQVDPAGDVTLWSATQTPHIQRFVLQLVLGHPRVEDPGDRSGRRWRLRLEDPGLRRGPARDRAGSAPRAPREVDGGARRELRRHDPRPRRRARADLRRAGATAPSPR